MIIVCGGIKGGSGKTTVATNLTIMRAAEGRDVLLVDADDQETASDFTQLRSDRLGETAGAGFTSIKLSGAAVRTQVMKLREKYDDIVIDTGGRDTTSQRAALTVADLLLVPFVPRSFDLWTIERVESLVAEMRAANEKLRAATFINRADPTGQDNRDMAEALRESTELEYSGIALGTRKAFGNASAKGLAVCELKPGDPKAQPDPKALEEMQALYTWVFSGAPMLLHTPGHTVPCSACEAAHVEISNCNQSDINQEPVTVSVSRFSVADLEAEDGNGDCA